MKRAKRFAARRARATGIGKNGHPNDDYYARELVQDALADTTLGVLPAFKVFVRRREAGSRWTPLKLEPRGPDLTRW